MALEPFLRYQGKFSWHDLASSLTHRGIQLFHRHEPAVRQYLEGLNYSVGTQDSIPHWTAYAPDQDPHPAGDPGPTDEQVRVQLAKIFERLND